MLILELNLVTSTPNAVLKAILAALKQVDATANGVATTLDDYAGEELRRVYVVNNMTTEQLTLGAEGGE